jgi:dienelactone hydrolase
MVTMIYWSPTMAEGRMEPEDIHNLVAAFEYLSGRDYVDPERVGIGGFCIGASYSIMAAAQEPIREQVAFVNAFGPYFHLPDLLAAITSRTHTYGDVTQDWKPDKLSLEVYVNHMTEDLPENERSLLREGFNEDAAIPDDAIQSLSDEGKAVHTLLLGVPREEVAAYRSRIPAETLERGDRISPSQYIDDLVAPLLIMHDRKDRLVPVSESRRLRDALADRGEVRYTEFGLFRHVTPDLRLGPWETAKELGKLFLHLHGILMQST